MPIGVKKVARRPQGFWEKLYLPAILQGMKITFSHMFMKKETMQYPEEKWTVRDNYRGAPVLVMDDEGRPKCVACSLCEFVCPPKAIDIVPGELEPGNPVERGPTVFNINMLRCIFCGLCEEACPEEAIFLTETYEYVGATREEMVFDKEKLLEIGGVREKGEKKWKKEGNAGFHRKGPSR